MIAKWRDAQRGESEMQGEAVERYAGQPINLKKSF